MSTSNDDAASKSTCPLLGILVLFIFQCIALKNSNTDTYYAACGHKLWDLTVGSVVISTAGIFIMGIISCALYCCCNKSVGMICAVVFASVYIFAEIFLSGYILNESVVALNNSNCTAAMGSTNGGINSISANTGSPLLAIIGIVNSALTFLIVAIFLCLCALSTAFVAFFQGLISFQERQNKHGNQ